MALSRRAHHAHTDPGRRPSNHHHLSAESTHSRLRTSTPSPIHSDEPSDGETLAYIHRRSGSDTNTHPRRRSQRELSPEDYAALLYVHAARSITTSVFPGHNYNDLATWLRSSQPPSPSSSSEKPDQHCLAVFYDLGPLRNPGRTWYIHGYELDILQNMHRPQHDEGQVLLLRGCPSSEWVKAIGGKYRVDPEFFRRHLDFFAAIDSRSLFSHPALPSTSSNIIRLTSSTILYGDASRCYETRMDVHQIRQYETQDMARYRRQYQLNQSCGDSVVRDFSTLDEKYAVVEQNISICVQRNGQGWIAIVWLDAGRNLLVSPLGPWCINLHHGYEAFPVIQHHPKMTLLQGTVEGLAASDPDHAIKDFLTQRGGGTSQSLSMLPFEFDIFLDPSVAKTDPFYALHNIFNQVASSEMQVLNVLDTRIRHEMGVLTDERYRSHSLDNLQYFTMFLDRHIDHITQTLQTVKRGGSPDWPGKSGTSKRATTAANKLQEDFEGLLAKALDLRRQCSEGMGVMMNRAVVAESRKAIEQAERVKRLTVLATVFIPLSFVTSFFGMNFREFGEGTLSIWVFGATCLPILLGSYVAFVWDDNFNRPFKALFRAFQKLWRRPDQVV